MREFHPEDFLARKTLVLGEINSGKTTFTRSLLEAFCVRGLGNLIAVVDMAPEIQPRKPESEEVLAGVGGKLEPPGGHGVLYLSGRFDPPRLSSKTDDEAMEKARRNRAGIEALLRELDREPRDIVFINDVSMYVQAGSAADLIRRLDAAAAAVVNGYWGVGLGTGKISAHERSEMERLRSWFERHGQVLIL